MSIGNVLTLVLLCAVYAALFLWLVRSAGTPRYVAAKALCSATFVAAAVAFGMLGAAPARLWLMLPGFVLCALGDILLALYNLHRQKWQMLVGMLLFFSAYSTFFASFCTRDAIDGWDFTLPVLGSVVVLGLLFLPQMDVRGMHAPAVLYSYVVAMMFGKAVDVALSTPTVFAVITALGAGLAMVSDLIIIFLYFYRPAKKNRTVHLANLVTYYLGIFLMAVGLLG